MSESLVLEPVRQNVVIDLGSLYAHPRNYMQHPPDQVKKIAASLKRWGQVRSIVVQANPDGLTYTIVAGHGVVIAAQFAIDEDIAQIARFGRLRADVIPSSWSQEQVLGYLVADNNLAQGSSPDDDLFLTLLEEQFDAGYSLASLGTDEETLREMLDAAHRGEEEEAGGTDQTGDEETDALVDETQTRVRVGDVWELGRHRVACFDSCDVEQVRTLVDGQAVTFVFADPPYGVSIVGSQQGEKKTGTVGGSKPFGSKNTRGKYASQKVIKATQYAPVIGDNSIETAVTSSQMCLEIFPDALQIWWGANYYAHALPPSSCWVVWDKETNGNFADAELAWCSDTSVVRIFAHMWSGMLKESEQGERRVHPTQKPVALARWCFEQYGKEQDVIYDPFLGSGISVLAAEQMHRTVIGCELSPDYVEVVIRRWEHLTGKEARLLHRNDDHRD